MESLHSHHQNRHQNLFRTTTTSLWGTSTLESTWWTGDLSSQCSRSPYSETSNSLTISRMLWKCWYLHISRYGDTILDYTGSDVEVWNRLLSHVDWLLEIFMKRTWVIRNLLLENLSHLDCIFSGGKGELNEAAVERPCGRGTLLHPGHHNQWQWHNPHHPHCWYYDNISPRHHFLGQHAPMDVDMIFPGAHRWQSLPS